MSDVSVQPWVGGWPGFGFDVLAMLCEAQFVIGLRLQMIATCHARTETEVPLMIAEKVDALLEMHSLASRCCIAGDWDRVPAESLAVLKDKVHDNAERLFGALVQDRLVS